MKRSLNRDDKKTQQNISIKRWVLDKVYEYAEDNQVPYISDLFEKAIIKYLKIEKEK